MRALTRKFITEHFNPIIEEDPNVRYYAVAGDPGNLQVVHPWLRPEYRDLLETDPAAGGGPNDGLVTVTSSLFGKPPPVPEGQVLAEPAPDARSKWKALGVLEADHIAEVGLELRVKRPNTYNHLAFFAGLAQFLDGILQGRHDPPERRDRGLHTAAKIGAGSRRPRRGLIVARLIR